MESKRDFTLRGYTLPLSPEGSAALVDPPPWYYGGDVMHLVFRGDPERMAALLPPPLEPGPEEGEGVVWFVEWVSASETRPDLAYLNPERSIYRECIVMVRCQYEGTAGYYVPFIWVDNDFTLMRGFIQGFPKKLGRVFITRLHELNPKVGGKRAGARVKGICESHGERIVEGSMTFTESIGAEAVPPVKFYLMRHFPDVENPSKPVVHEIAASTVEGVQVAGAWKGEGEVLFNASAFEEVAGLGPVAGVAAYHYSMGIIITGGKVLYRYP